MAVLLAVGPELPPALVGFVVAEDASYDVMPALGGADPRRPSYAVGW